MEAEICRSASVQILGLEDCRDQGSGYLNDIRKVRNVGTCGSVDVEI